MSITPTATGTITVGFKVNDKMADPSRAVQSTITVTVTDKPAVPTGVRAEAVGPNGARVTFDAPESNGSPITEYRVFDQNGRQVATCSTNVCSVVGLSVGETYSFTVEAVNKEGESKPSKASNTITISGAPGRPGAPLLTAGDGTIKATWAAAKANGSPVTGYTATATTANGQASSCTTTGETECTILGLLNGSNYTVTVVARNAKGESAPSDGASATPQAKRRGPEQPVITSAVPKQSGDSMLLDVSWTLGSSGSSGWGTTTIRVGDQTATAAGGSTYHQVSVTPDTTVNVSVTVTNLQGESATSNTRTVTIPALTPVEEPKTIPLAPDAPHLGPPSDNALGKLRISNARLKEGNGYKAADLELFYADSAAGCTAPGNPLRLNNGDRGDFDLGPLNNPGETMTFYFCQRGKRGPNDYVWSPVVSASGTVGNGQRDGGGGNQPEPPQPDPGNDKIPNFTVDADPHINSATISWTPPAGVSLKQTTIWIEGLEDSTRQRFTGPMTQVTMSPLKPVHEYTVVVDVENNAGAHRIVKKTFTTGESVENINAVFTGKTTCPNGQECGSMTLTATRAAQFQPGKTLVCTVSTGRPAQDTEFRFSQGTPSIPGILTEAITARELNARQVVKSCHGE